MGGGDGADAGGSIKLITHGLPALRGQRFLHEGKACWFGVDRDGGEEHAVVEARVGVAHLQIDDAANASQLGIAFFQTKHFLRDGADDRELELVAQ